MICENYIFECPDKKKEISAMLIIEDPVESESNIGYETKVFLQGFFDEGFPIKGETSYHALQNSCIFIKRLISGYQRKGWLVSIAKNGVAQHEVMF